jgi:murein L,D-transpeptidase YcbB/YkuD
MSAGRSNRPAPLSFLKGSIAAVAVLAMVPTAAQAQRAPGGIEAAIRSATGSERDLRDFYQARGNRPLWIRGSQLGPEAELLLDLIQTAEVEGLDPGTYRPRALESAIRRADGGSPKALARAEMLLSRTFAAYARDVRRPRDVGMIYVDKALAPTVPTASSLLQAAAVAPSLEQHLEGFGWMHPVYGQLRRALASAGYDRTLSPQQEQILRLNLERARVLPGINKGRHVLVDVASARLWMYEDGHVRDSMKVVVGKAAEQTPMMAGLIRFTMVNPYWNIPPDLARVRAAEVVKKGPAFLKARRYEALSDWSEDAKVLKPSEVDWKAVAAGRKELPMRQLPGKDNAMGKMKFMFPNEQGIYLHDTPERNLFTKAERRFSSGCVRVEDATRLAKWLYQKPLPVPPGGKEKRVDLPEPVPVYITYLTAVPEGEGIAFVPDSYNRDRTQMAGLGLSGSGGGR